MSWWDTGEGDDVIGDQPADLARHALERIAEERSRERRPKPTLSELLWALGLAASRAEYPEIERTDSEPKKIVARLKSGETLSSGPLDEAADKRDLLAEIVSCLHAVSEIYHSRWKRGPRLSEWLSCFAFVLRARPADYLEDGAQRHPVAIASE